MNTLLSFFSLSILLCYADITAQTYTPSLALALNTATPGHLSPMPEHTCGPVQDPSPDLPSSLASHPIHP